LRRGRQSLFRHGAAVGRRHHRAVGHAPRAGTGALSDAERADPKNEIWRIQDVRVSMLRILSVWLVSLGVMVSASPAFAAFDRLIDPNCSDESDCAYWIPKLPP